MLFKKRKQTSCEVNKRYNTWVKRYPLVVSSSEGFRIKLRTLMLFETNTGAGTGLKNKKPKKNTTNHAKKWRFTTWRDFFYDLLIFSCSTVEPYLVWTELVLFRRANAIWAVYILCVGQPEPETTQNNLVSKLYYSPDSENVVLFKILITDWDHFVLFLRTKFE